MALVVDAMEWIGLDWADWSGLDCTRSGTLALTSAVNMDWYRWYVSKNIRNAFLSFQVLLPKKNKENQKISNEISPKSRSAYNC